eukprot:TRINITY_DN20225_c0_g1_i2.p1 TRINITY_DN20225_c0_g1~~TRINITY_DN20225_c0_g1_i2.p1  ORF type:complete len:415 (-),score=67.13 TRINITY_DN20225_c0_g1_i2:112-1239(-)
MLSLAAAVPGINATYDTPTGTLRITNTSSVASSAWQQALQLVQLATAGRSEQPKSVRYDAGYTGFASVNGTNWYFAVPCVGCDWFQALASAAANPLCNGQGWLATIDSEAEKNATETIRPTGMVPWIAASDSEQEGNFRWMAGPEKGQLVQYKPWYSPDPNGGTTENWVFVELGMWRDAAANNTFPNAYLLECAKPPTQLNVTTVVVTTCGCVTPTFTPSVTLSVTPTISGTPTTLNEPLPPQDPPEPKRGLSTAAITSVAVAVSGTVAAAVGAGMYFKLGGKAGNMLTSLLQNETQLSLAAAEELANKRGGAFAGDDIESQTISGGHSANSESEVKSGDEDQPDGSTEDKGNEAGSDTPSSPFSLSVSLSAVSL